jgi:hypothetical protein
VDAARERELARHLGVDARAGVERGVQRRDLGRGVVYAVSRTRPAE